LARASPARELACGLGQKDGSITLKRNDSAIPALRASRVSPLAFLARRFKPAWRGDAAWGAISSSASCRGRHG